MSLFDQPPPRDFADRAIRELFSHPRNLRDLLSAILPDLAGHLDFERVRPVERSFLLDDWRAREADLLFEIPFRDDPATEEQETVLICLLIEHHSTPDPAMPLRTLLYAVLYWVEEWKVWERGHQRGQSLSLTPIVPIVFHTGAQPWHTHRTMADLLTAPGLIHVYVTGWEPLFWELRDRAAEDLLHAAGEGVQALAVVRAEQEQGDAFRRVYQEALRRLEGLADREWMRWHDLVRFVVCWALVRRPAAERQELLLLARESQVEASRREEVRKMIETIERTWPEELLAEGMIQGELRHARKTLRMLLEERFGSLPEELAQQIEDTTDLERLEDAFRRAVHIPQLSQFAL